MPHGTIVPTSVAAETRQYHEKREKPRDGRVELMHPSEGVTMPQGTPIENHGLGAGPGDPADADEPARVARLKHLFRRRADRPLVIPN